MGHISFTICVRCYFQIVKFFFRVSFFWLWSFVSGFFGSWFTFGLLFLSFVWFYGFDFFLNRFLFFLFVLRFFIVRLWFCWRFLRSFVSFGIQLVFERNLSGKFSYSFRTSFFFFFRSFISFSLSFFFLHFFIIYNFILIFLIFLFLLFFCISFFSVIDS